jgi:hypothetical protein
VKKGIDSVETEQIYEIWVQDLTDCNMFCNRRMGLKLPESALENRQRTVIKIIYDGEHAIALPLGYVRDADDQIVIDPAGAEVVRQIFGFSASGFSADKIAKKLESANSRNKKLVWTAANVRQVLENEETYHSGLLESDSSLRLPPILQ